MTTKKKIIQRTSGLPIRHAVRDEFYQAVAAVLRAARSKAYRAVDLTMVEAYWNVGRMIVEEEQEGKERAEYGAFIIQNLSFRLKEEFGKGFTEQNLRNFRQFYLCFPMWNGLRSVSQEVLKPGQTMDDKIRYALRGEIVY